MCGIAGIFHYAEPALAARETVARMVAPLRHRGPDDQGVHLAGTMGLGHARLSIIDVAGGHQPIFSEDRTVAVVCNGEIYNHRELRQGLEERGHRFATRSDTEVIVHLWEELGAGCVERLAGMFALAVADFRRRTLLLARDRVGKKPLYLADDGRRLGFASELKSLLAAGLVRPEIDPEAVDLSLAYGYGPGPGALFRGAAAVGHLPRRRHASRRPSRAGRRAGRARRALLGRAHRGGPGRRPGLRRPAGLRARAAAGRGRARPPGERRAAGRLPLRRARLRDPRLADERGRRQPGAHPHRGLRRPRRRRAGGRRGGGAGPGRRPYGDRGAARPGGRAAADRLAPRRAVRRSVVRAHLVRVARDPAAGDGGHLGRRRRRAVRRLRREVRHAPDGGAAALLPPRAPAPRPLPGTGPALAALGPAPPGPAAGRAVPQSRGG